MNNSGLYIAAGIGALFVALFSLAILDSNPDILPQMAVVWVALIAAFLYRDNRDVLIGIGIGAIVLIVALSSGVSSGIVSAVSASSEQAIAISDILIAALVIAAIYLVATRTDLGERALKRLGFTKDTERDSE